MVDPERDIAQLEALLKKLEKEYDQFFAGQLRREPAATENTALALIRAYGTRPIQNATLAFKFNSLVARYNSFRTVWTRRLREKEEGRGPGAHLRPAAAAPAGGPEVAEYLSMDPRHESRRLQHLFDTYRHLREECGEPTERLKVESFQRVLAEKVDKIKQSQGCEAVLIRVVKEAGKTRIVAKPFRRPPAGTSEGS